MTTDEKSDLVSRFPQYTENINIYGSLSYQFVLRQCEKALSKTCPVSVKISQEMRR